MKGERETKDKGSWTGYRDLNNFIKYLKKNDELIEIDEEIAPGLEVAQILKVLGDRDGPVVRYHES